MILLCSRMGLGMHKIDFVWIWGAQDAHRAHLHTTRLCVFLCVCVLRPAISEATHSGQSNTYSGTPHSAILPRPNLSNLLNLLNLPNHPQKINTLPQPQKSQPYINMLIFGSLRHRVLG